METVERRLRDSLLPDNVAARQTMEREAARYGDALGADGSWPDIDYRDQTRGPWKTSAHLERLLTLTRAYRTLRLPPAGQAQRKARILLALDYWLRNDFQNPNWWHNQIGVPGQIGSIMLLLRDETTPEQRDKAVAILRRSTLRNMTGANLVWMARNQIVRGCLEQSPAVMAEAFDALWREIHVAPPGKEGIQADNSFHQHGPVLYNGGYGASFTGDCAQFIAYARDTRFAVPGERLRLFENFVLDGQQWMIRGTFYDYGVIGRQIVRPNQNAGGLRRVADILSGEPGPRRQEMRAFAERLKAAPGAPPLAGNRHFWRSDFMAHHRPGYYTSARMFSTRTFNTDGYINSEGKKSHHVADGVTYIFQRGDEYKDIFPVWDWRRVPGATIEQSPAPLDPARVQSRGKTSFVGGVSDGTYGAAAMDLVRDALSARKAWFYFDDEWVCLGAGITGASGNAVLTSVNQCLLNGPVRVSDRPAALAAGEHALPSIRWVLHDGIGYVFPGQTSLHVANRAQSGSWSDIGAGSPASLSREVFSLWIDHGARPANAAYAYIVVPGASAANLAARIPAVQTLANTPDLQAVRHPSLKVLLAVFRRPGLLDGRPGWTVRVDQPCLTLLREMPGGMRIAVSNPENQPLAVTIEIDRKLEGEGSTPGRDGTTIRFDLPDGPDAGRSVVRFLKQNPGR